MIIIRTLTTMIRIKTSCNRVHAIKNDVRCAKLHGSHLIYFHQCNFNKTIENSMRFAQVCICNTTRLVNSTLNCVFFSEFLAHHSNSIVNIFIIEKKNVPINFQIERK